MEIKDSLLKKIEGYQKNEITEHHIYKRLAANQNDEKNRKILEGIADDELRHYEIWKKYTGKASAPSRFKITAFYFVSKILGLTFGIKLLERGEEEAGKQYEAIRSEFPEADSIIKDENEHENELISLLNEERLKYVGSIVLGLNDALVELTGGLAGLTLAFQKTSLVALSGLIVGISAALSMSASEYLSTKAEGGDRNPVKSSIYTGIAYIFTVFILVSPFLILASPFLALLSTLVAALIIIALFNFYISIAKDTPFLKPFIEMAGISFFVAVLSFFIGYALKIFLGVDIE